jgi:hypothetical protein
MAYSGRDERRKREEERTKRGRLSQLIRSGDREALPTDDKHLLDALLLVDRDRSLLARWWGNSWGIPTP